MSTFGERLKQARERMGWSQKEASARLHITDKSLSRYETDTTFPNYETLSSFVTVYDVSSDFLLGLSPVLGHAPKDAAPGTPTPPSVHDKIEDLSPEDRKKAEEYIDMLRTLSEVKNGSPAIDLPKRA